MFSTKEITDISRLDGYRAAWRELLRQTPGVSFFQSLEWLEVYWEHFGKGKLLRVLVVEEDRQPIGILPFIVQKERTRVGTMRILTYPLDNWASFYGPIGPQPEKTLTVGLEHLQHSPRDWDFLELRFGGAPGVSGTFTSNALEAAGMRAYPSLWGKTAMVDLSQGWEAYQNTRKGLWRRRLRQAEAKLERQAKVEYVRYRPMANDTDNEKPRWDYFGECQKLAEKSWQSSATDGTTLSHPSVQPFLHDLHAVAVAEGAVDINLLLLDGRPAAFIYGYHYRGYVFGLRRGFDAGLSRTGVGNVLLWHTLRDSARRGDLIYDMGSGSQESKRHFLTHLMPIYRHSHFPNTAMRAQLLRFRRWWEGRQLIEK
jgi:hypothetical protein